MAPPPTPAAGLPTTAAAARPSTGETPPSPVIALVLRVLTFLALLISVILIGTNTIRGFKFNDFSAYSYMFASGIIGIIYTFTQIGFKISHLTAGYQSGLDGWLLIDFYGDKVLSYMLATGAAAGFGLTVDLNHSSGRYSGFLNKANGSASLLFFAFVFSAVSSVFSSFALIPKRP
ncbi:hypothetical protein ABFX02_06G148000 [Erythranthe guttata]